MDKTKQSNKSQKQNGFFERKYQAEEGKKATRKISIINECADVGERLLDKVVELGLYLLGFWSTTWPELTEPALCIEVPNFQSQKQ
jgi:hypothetical protein